MLKIVISLERDNVAEINILLAYYLLRNKQRLDNIPISSDTLYDR